MINKYKNPIRYGLAWLQNHGCLDKLNDKAYCGLILFSRTGHFPDYKNPKGFNEKMQWLKLNNRDDALTRMVDKYEAKLIVKEKLGQEYVARLIARYETVEDIDFDILPNQFVLKCTHDGGVIVCKDKNKLDREKVKSMLADKLKVNYFLHAREWPYKNIVPSIIAEEYLQDGCKENLPVYKFLCFSGEPKIIQTIQNDKQPNETIDYFDTEWNLLDLRQNYPNSKYPLARPELLDEMLKVARELCKGYPFIRVDLYQVNTQIVFSEFTFFSDAGFEQFHPQKWDRILGDWIDLEMVDIK